MRETMRNLFLLCFILAYAQGYAIIGTSKLALTASSLNNRALISLQQYSVDEELPDTQNWIHDEQGYIRIKHYPQYVMELDENSMPILKDISTIIEQKFAKWNIYPAEDKYYIRNKGNSFTNLRRSSLIDGLFFFFDPFPTFDYIVVGAGTAGCKISKRLSDNFNNSVLTLEAGKRVDDNPLVHDITTIREVEGSSLFNFQYYSERILNLGATKVPAAVGRMWGGTSNHNGMLYSKGLKYDWQLMEKFGGPKWNYDNYIKAIYLSQENYTGNISTNYGVGGEINLVDSVHIPDTIAVPVINATKTVYPTFGSFDLDGNPFTNFKLTMTNYNGYIRESSSTAFFGQNVVTTNGKGVGGRQLKVLSEVFADRLIFHPFHTHRAIGIWYIDRDGKSQRAYANKEIILAAGVYNSPAILMRSGVGNCTELAAINITCRENNVYVGSNLQDHTRVQVQLLVPLSNFLAIIASIGSRNTDGRFVGGVFKSPLAENYTDFSVTNTTQPDSEISLHITSQIPYSAINTIFGLTYSAPPAKFELAGILLRPKCTGKVSIASSNPSFAPVINADYLCHPDDLNWARQTFQGIMSIIDHMNKTFDPSYQAIFPSRDDINTEAKLMRWVRGLTTSYRHPCGSLRMAPRDNVNKGAVNNNLCVYGIQRVRVGDASIFPIIPSANLQASVYAVGGKVVDFINDPSAACN